MSRSILLLTLWFVAAAALPVGAQGLPELEPQQRIRVTAPALFARSMEGFFSGQRSDTLLMFHRNFPYEPQTTLVPFNAIARLEVRAPRSRSVGAWRGFAIGAVAGGLLGALVRPESTDLPGDAKDYVLGGALGVGLIGALIGVVAPGEGWRAVPLR